MYNTASSGGKAIVLLAMSRQSTSFPPLLVDPTSQPSTVPRSLPPLNPDLALIYPYKQGAGGGAGASAIHHRQATGDWVGNL